MQKHTDILIVGGGLVGTSLAIALDKAGIKATMVEARLPPAKHQPIENERNLALARASFNGLSHLGVWPYMREHATAIQTIHVSRKGDFGAMRMRAERLGVDAFGYTMPASKLGYALNRRLEDCQGLDRQVPATVSYLEHQADGWLAGLQTEQGEMDIHARLLVGADGSHSFVRDNLGIKTDTYDYAHTLFVASIGTEKPLHGRAFERFTDQGPIALLPLENDRAGLVLSVAHDEAEKVAALSDKAFLAFARQRFGWRVGHFSNPGKRYQHPITRLSATSTIGKCAVLVGNAAQTIHPVGAQGFNLGLRDALTLAEMVQQAEDPGDAGLLEAYVKRRQPDRDGVMAMSHGLARLACMPGACLSPVRSMLMLAMDRMPSLRHTIMRHGMGFRGQPPMAVLEQTG